MNTGKRILPPLGSKAEAFENCFNGVLSVIEFFTLGVLKIFEIFLSFIAIAVIWGIFGVFIWAIFNH